MGLLSQFFRSDKKLTRPNFQTSGKEQFNFSDNLIEVVDPKQTALIPLTTSINKLDIYNMKQECLQKRGNYVELFYKRGWNFWGKGSEAKGGIICDMRVSYFPEELVKSFNQFKSDDQAKSLLLHWFVIWGKQAESPRIGTKGKDLDFVYPVTKEDIKVEKRGDVEWLKSSGTYKNEPPLVKYSIPLSARHNLIISFGVHAYRGLDFHSPETNLKETAYAVIDEFMDNIKITYSERSLADLKEVTG